MFCFPSGRSRAFFPCWGFLFGWCCFTFGRRSGKGCGFGCSSFDFAFGLEHKMIHRECTRANNGQSYSCGQHGVVFDPLAGFGKEPCLNLLVFLMVSSILLLPLVALRSGRRSIFLCGCLCCLKSRHCCCIWIPPVGNHLCLRLCRLFVVGHQGGNYILNPIE